MLIVFFKFQSKIIVYLILFFPGIWNVEYLDMIIIKLKNRTEWENLLFCFSYTYNRLYILTSEHNQKEREEERKEEEINICLFMWWWTRTPSTTTTKTASATTWTSCCPRTSNTCNWKQYLNYVYIYNWNLLFIDGRVRPTPPRMGCVDGPLPIVGIVCTS